MVDNDSFDEDYVVDLKSVTLKEIQIELMRKITHLSAVELRGGFWTMMTDAAGKEQRVYIPDTRDALTNAILCQIMMLKHKFDDKMKKDYEEFKKKSEEEKKNFLSNTEMKDSEVLGEDYYKGKEKILHEEYKIRKVRLYLDLFSNLCSFLSRKPILGGASGVY